MFGVSENIHDDILQTSIEPVRFGKPDCESVDTNSQSGEVLGMSTPPNL